MILILSKDVIVAHRIKCQLREADIKFILGKAFHRLMLQVGRAVKNGHHADTAIVYAKDCLTQSIYEQVKHNHRHVSWAGSNWSFDKALAWLKYYSKETAKIFQDDGGLLPILFEAALEPFVLLPEDENDGVSFTVTPDLIARDAENWLLGVYDYKTASFDNYEKYMLLNETGIDENHPAYDKLMKYGTVALFDKHTIAEVIGEVGYIVVPREPLPKDLDKALPILLIFFEFNQGMAENWRARMLAKFGHRF